MQFKSKALITLVAIGFSVNAQAEIYKSAGQMVNSKTCPSGLYLLLGSGGSFSRNANISVDLTQWDPANEGYNARVGNTALYTAGIGYLFMPAVSVDIEVTRRPTYSYSKYQTPVPGSSTPGALGTKTRNFDLDNTTIMANMYLNGQGVNLFADLGANTILQPFVGAGIGIAYNTVSNFHSVLATSSVPGSVNVSSIMNSNTQTAFAWQVLAGLEVLHADQWGLDLGYRFFDGGIFKSNNYFVNAPSGLTSPVTTSPWKGKLTANEVFLNLKYIFK